jgi:ADP-heptose:LPS heptosyltransferase
MTLRAKQLIDNWLGTPLCLILNLLARFLGIVLRRDHNLTGSPRTIVISKYLGIGSVINAFPLINALRKRYPSVRIVFISTAELSQVLGFFPDVDQILLIQEDNLFSLTWSTLVVLIQLWRMKPEVFVDLEVFSRYSSIVTTLSCTRNRIGFYLESTLFRKGLYTHLIYFNRFNHIQEIYGRIGHILGVSEKDLRERRMLTVPESAAVEARLFLTEVFGSVNDFIIVNPNAGSLCLERRWPSKQMAEITTILAREEMPVVLTGSPQELGYVESVYAQIPADVQARVAISAGRLSFAGFVALIRLARLTITNDSGPFHLAVILGAPTVSLWGPGSPRMYGAVNGRHIAIEGIVYCHPCLYMTDRPPCRGHNICMQSIQVQQVLKAVKVILSKDAPTTPTIWHSGEMASDPEYIPGVVMLRKTTSERQG